MGEELGRLRAVAPQLAAEARAALALAPLAEPTRAELVAARTELMRHPKAHERWLRAELHGALGDEAEALCWYASCPDPAAYDVAYLAASHLHRGESFVRRGEQAAADAHYRRFLALWGDADPRLLARVREVRERLAR